MPELSEAALQDDDIAVALTPYHLADSGQDDCTGGAGGDAQKGSPGRGGGGGVVTCQAAAQTWSLCLHTPPVPSTCHWPPPGG